MSSFRQAVSSGFTLIEMVATILVIAVVSAVVAVFLRGAVEGFSDAGRRSDLAYIAGQVSSRLSAELGGALSNSVRVSMGNNSYLLEFLEVRTGGRYRALSDTAWVSSPFSCNVLEAESDVLTIGAADTCFRSLGEVSGLTSIVADSDFLVIANSGTGFVNANAWENGNASGGNKSIIRGVAGVSEVRITFDSNTFIQHSPGKRFFVVKATPVSYLCKGDASGADTGTLRKFWGYPLQAAQPDEVTLLAHANALVAQHVTRCDAPGVSANLVSMVMEIGRGNERLNLFHQIRVDNGP